MDHTHTLARVRALLARMLPDRIGNGSDGVEAITAALRAVGGPVTMLNLDVGPDSPKIPVADGPMTGFHVVDGRGRLVGELLLWVADGHPTTLEYAWYTEEPPTDLPAPQRVLIEASDSRGDASAAPLADEVAADPPSALRLTEEMVALVMRLLVSGEITRPVACQFVSPWVEGDLPSSDLAHSGAQTVHGLDLVGDGAGRMWHAPSLSDDYEFIVGRDEMVLRCEQWLNRYRLAGKEE